MDFKLNSLRSQLILMITLIGSIGLISAVILVNINYQNNIEIVKESTRELIKQEFITLSNKHTSLLSEFGIRLQNNPLFKNAIRNKNTEIITSFINDEFHQYYVTAKVLVINKVYAFDKNYQLLSESSEGNAFSTRTRLCSQLVEIANKRKKSARIKPINSFCYYKDHALNSVIVPIGTLRPIGYLQIVSTPFNIFSTAVNKLGMPLKINTGSHQSSYQSTKWEETNPDNILVTHQLPDINGNSALILMMKKDVTNIHHTFNQSRLFIIFSIGFITLLAIAIFYYRLEKGMLKPLALLEKKLSEMELDENEIGNTVSPKGFPEIKSLINKYNTLSLTLSGLYKSLENLAYRDPLTSLANRAKLLETLNIRTNLSRQRDADFTLIIFNINRFKSINDTMGHHIGDLLLQELSARLILVLRKTNYFGAIAQRDEQEKSVDYVYRMGGDEFAIVFPDTSDVQKINLIVQQLLESLKDTFEISNFSFNLSVSIGVAICPVHGNKATALMQHADTAMYTAKEKNLDYVIYNTKLSEHSISFVNMDTNLRNALKNNELSLAFQPKIDMKTNRVVAIEVLLRWFHQDQGFIPPDKFIKIAEQSGLINDITFWVIQAALKQKGKWQKQNINISISINLSAKNLFDNKLIPFIREELKKNNVMPQTVVLELTETAIMSDPEYGLTILQQLNDLGLKLSIDDFGTGYSSLSYLNQLPVNEIKIDQSFIRGMETNENDIVIVRSTIDLAHNMGMQVVAEGVETDIIYKKLQEQSCDLAQGYYMAKPMNNDDFIYWLKNSEWGLK